MRKTLFNNEISQIGFEYVKLLLEVKYGCKVNYTGENTGAPTMAVWSPKGYDRSTINVMTEPEGTETIAVLVARIINGRTVPILVDYHIIKVGGIEGIYSLEEETLQKLLLDKKYLKKTASEDGSSLFTLFPRQLLLDSCSFFPA